MQLYGHGSSAAPRFFPPPSPCATWRTVSLGRFAQFSSRLVPAQVLAGVIPEPKGQKGLSRDAKGLIEGMLKKEPTERLGCMKAAVEEVKKHPFFTKINFQRLDKKLIQVTPCDVTECNVV